MSNPLNEIFDTEKRRAIRNALTRDAYDRDLVRIADPDLTDFTWLVATHRDAFAVNATRAKPVLHGCFFGVDIHKGHLYLFENCERRRDGWRGRVIRARLNENRIGNAEVIVTGLHNNCHQLRVFDGMLHVVDTANQRILRYTMDGTMIDSKTPFPPARRDATDGSYLHINSIAKIGEKIGLVLHNGKAEPRKKSEIVWFDADWNLLSRSFLNGHGCHDIVADDAGTLWYSASAEGGIADMSGRFVPVSDDLMTRGISFTQDAAIIGISSFGPRQIRDSLGGRVVISTRTFDDRTIIDLPGPPTDIVALR